MRDLRRLLKGIGYTSSMGLDAVMINRVEVDSRLVNEGDLFVALAGTRNNGHDYIEEAVRKGGAAIVAERKRSCARVPVISVENTRRALASIASRYYGSPSRYIKVVAITGTNGKTTVSYLIESILDKAGKKAGVIGTIKYKIGPEELDAEHTTPSPIILQRLLQKMASGSLDYCVMEVSSHALDQDRTYSIGFRCAIFTNATPEHLDYHGLFDNYLQAKVKIFKGLTPDGMAIINRDDKNFNKIRGAAGNNDVMTYGLSSEADVYADNISLDLDHSSYRIRSKMGDISISSRLIGEHNIYNALAAACAGIAEGVSPNVIKKGLEAVGSIPGRLEALNDDGPRIFIDYAHTDDALKKVLSALTTIKTGGLITVFGCGGDRDKAKRPRMGAVASRLSDKIFITTDNPRGEDPVSIINDILKGVDVDKKKYFVIKDRERAIEEAIISARKEDIILIAGKGHEKYQLLADKKIAFDDVDIARRVLCRRSSLTPRR